MAEEILQIVIKDDPSGAVPPGQSAGAAGAPPVDPNQPPPTFTPPSAGQASAAGGAGSAGGDPLGGGSSASGPLGSMKSILSVLDQNHVAMMVSGQKQQQAAEAASNAWKAIVKLASDTAEKKTGSGLPGASQQGKGENSKTDAQLQKLIDAHRKMLEAQQANAAKEAKENLSAWKYVIGMLPGGNFLVQLKHQYDSLTWATQRITKSIVGLFEGGSSQPSAPVSPVKVEIPAASGGPSSAMPVASAAPKHPTQPASHASPRSQSSPRGRKPSSSGRPQAARSTRKTAKASGPGRNRGGASRKAAGKSNRAVNQFLSPKPAPVQPTQPAGLGGFGGVRPQPSSASGPSANAGSKTAGSQWATGASGQNAGQTTASRWASGATGVSTRGMAAGGAGAAGGGGGAAAAGAAAAGGGGGAAGAGAAGAGVTALGVAAATVAAVLVAVAAAGAAAVMVYRKMASDAQQISRELAQTPAIAMGNAVRDLKQMLNNMSRGEKVGDAANRMLDAQMSLDQALSRAMDGVRAPLMRQIAPAVEKVAALVDKIAPKIEFGMLAAENTYLALTIALEKWTKWNGDQQKMAEAAGQIMKNLNEMARIALAGENREKEKNVKAPHPHDLLTMDRVGRDRNQNVLRPKGGQFNWKLP